MRPRDLLDVECLNGGGLYRRSAIADVGYLSDRNLHAFEEYDLGAASRQGLAIIRLEKRRSTIYGYAMGTWRCFGTGFAPVDSPAPESYFVLQLMVAM